MKIKKADGIMAVMIAAVAIAGVGIALKFRTEESKTQWGETYVVSSQTPKEGEEICTVGIYCNTILDHTDQLNDSKVPYVPENGVILEKTQVAFSEGETAFDVLCRICQEGGIQLEYSWTPLYDSYYVEGINQIYEFDCGGQSGWMYQVNGQFPNYGCSAYEVSPEDEIFWIYTCEGLGKDVGADMGE